MQVDDGARPAVVERLERALVGVVAHDHGPGRDVGILAEIGPPEAAVASTGARGSGALLLLGREEETKLRLRHGLLHLSLLRLSGSTTGSLLNLPQHLGLCPRRLQQLFREEPAEDLVEDVQQQGRLRLEGRLVGVLRGRHQ